MSPTLFVAQRATAAVLAFAVTIHLATILYAAQQGLTAAHILQRTHGNLAFLLLYIVFVTAASIHAPIGLRNIAHEWLGWGGRGLDITLTVFSAVLFVLGLRAAYAMFAA